jgi:hypothetical protein
MIDMRPEPGLEVCQARGGLGHPVSVCEAQAGGPG